MIDPIGLIAATEMIYWPNDFSPQDLKSIADKFSHTWHLNPQKRSLLIKKNETNYVIGHQCTNVLYIANSLGFNFKRFSKHS